MEIGHDSTKKKTENDSSNYVMRTLTNEHLRPTSNSNGFCSLCRGSGNCSFCLQTKKQVMELNSNIEFVPPLKKETTELREIKVESPHSPTTTLQPANNGHGLPPDALSITPSVSKSLVIDVENGTKTAIKKGTRKWRYFPGKNRFYCNGRLISAPNISFCLCCFLLIVVTFMLFIIFDGPYLADKWSIAVPISGVLMFLVVIVSMCKTTFSDPGIIPRASQQEAEYIERCYATNNVGRPPPRTKDVIVNGQMLKVKYCFTCKMFRPPRASHCGVCDNCVDRFDHHCPFLGNCIGKRNYRHFYSFVLSLSFLCVFVLSCATAHLVLISKDKGNFLEALKDSPTSAVVVVISFFGMWTVLGLAGFHTYLISVEQTTNEDIKGVFGRSAIKNPFSRGNIFQNCGFILCGPRQPSLIDSRGLVTEEFLIALPRKNDANGITPSTICNRNSLHMQTSLKTGPQCVEAANRPGVSKSQNQQQILGGVPHSVSSQSFSQISTPGQPPSTTQVAEGITLSRQSPDSGSGLLYNTSAGSNRSLSNMNSGSMRNLYNGTIEEDLATISADSGSESNLSHDHSATNRARVEDGHPFTTSRNKPSYRYESQTKDDFDDPTMLHISPKSFSSSSTSQPFEYGFDYNAETVLDMDDPISEQGLRRINSNNTAHTSSKRSAARGKNISMGGRDDSAISLPSTSGGGSSSYSKKKASSVQSLKSQGSLDGGVGSSRNRIGSTDSGTTKNAPTNSGKSTKRTQVQAMNNNGPLNQSTSSTSLKTRNGLPSSSSVGQSSINSNNSRISSRKLSKSTMIDSPLHLDPII